MSTRGFVRSFALVAAASCAAIAVLLPSSASAYQYEHVYCNQSLAVNATCPPNGSSEWAHMELNSANAGGESHATCVDDWYDNEKRYTEAHCMYYSSEGAAIQISSGQYGYPRAWNGGSITHFVYAEEYGYHTAAKSPGVPAADLRGSATPDLTRSLSALPGLDTAASNTVGGAYPVLVVPGQTTTCLLNGPAGMSIASAEATGLLGGVCGPTAGAQQRGLAETTESSSGNPVVIGLAPAGNSSVQVTDTNGVAQSVAVTSGVYEVTGGIPATVTLETSSGKAAIRHLAALSNVPPSAPAK